MPAAEISTTMRGGTPAASSASTGRVVTVMGGLTVTASVVAYLNPRIRLVEDELPDVVVEVESPDDDAAVDERAGKLEPVVAPAG